MRTLTYLSVATVFFVSSAAIAQEESGLNDPMDAMHAEQYDPANDPYEQRRAARANNRYEVYNPGGDWAHREESSYQEQGYGGDDASSYAQDYEESDGAYVEIDEGDSSADGEEDAYPIRNDPAEYEADYLAESYREQGGEVPDDGDYSIHHESDEYQELGGDELVAIDVEDQASQNNIVSDRDGENTMLPAYSENTEASGVDGSTEDLDEQALLGELSSIEQGGVSLVSNVNGNITISKLDDSAPSDPIEPALPIPFVPGETSASQDGMAPLE